MSIMAILKLNLRYYGRHRVLSLLCLLGIALGVGIVVAVELINNSALSSFAASVDLLSGKADHSVVSEYGRIEEKLFVPIWTNPHVKSAAPVVEVMATALQTGDEPIRFIGLDPFLDTEFRNLAPEGASRRELLSFVAGERAGAYLSTELMKRYLLKPGDTLTVLTAGVEKKIKILGGLPGSESFTFGDNIAVVDIGWAQEIFGRTGYLDRIDVVTSGSMDDVQKNLPEGLKLTDPSQRKSVLQAMLKSFQLNLAAMSLLALFVGVFLIYNFSMFSVLSRREETALLLTLGSDRRELVGAFLAESLLLAAVGSLLGIAFGYLVAWLSIEKVSSSISELYFYLRVQRVRLTLPTALTGVAVGFLATVVGTALPALEVAVTPPILGMKRRTIEDRAHGIKGLLLLGGSLWFIGALVAVWASRFSVFWGFVSAFGMTLAFALFTPSFLSPFTHYGGLWLRKAFGSLEGFLAARTIRASLSRTSIAVAALAVALAMTIGVDTMIYSFRKSVTKWLDGSLMGDLYVSPGTAKWGHPLPQSLVEKLLANPDVEAVERYATHEVTLRGRPVRLRVVDGRVLKYHSKFHFLERADRAWDRLMEGGAFISESLSHRVGLKVGERVVLKTPDGDRAFPIVAMVRDYSSDQGSIHIDRDVYEKIWRDNRVQSVAVFMKPAVPAEVVRKSIIRDFPELDRTVVSNTRMKRDILAIFDKTFAPTATLKGVSLLVALLGVATALMAILMERSAEITVLGYLGLTPGGIARMNVYQSLVMGLAAFLISIVCGLILTYIIVHAINYRSFGWSIDVSVNSWIFAKTLLLTTGACLAASVYPTYRLITRESITSLAEE